MRDVITRSDGRIVSGRVVTPTAQDQLLVLQGGKRLRIAHEDIAAVDLVGGRVLDFCRRRVRHKDNPRAQWFLVEWANTHGLEALARTQALLLALDSDHAEAHEFLGHHKTPKGWLWRHDGRLLTREKLHDMIAKRPFTIRGERFELECDHNLRANAAALLDLEHLGAQFYRRFGEDLQLAETLQPIPVKVSRNSSAFEKWGFRPVPYYSPPPHGDIARTFYAGATGERPEKLFFVGTQALLYRSLIGEVNRQSDRDRVCPWLEIGLSMLMENTMQGPSGFAAPGAPLAQKRQSLRAIGRRSRLGSLLHLPMYGGFYLMDDTTTATNWAASTMLVTWLLEPDNKPATHEPFLTYVREALGEGKGDSSSLFDRVMGQRIEDLEAPWRTWLEQTASH